MGGADGEPLRVAQLAGRTPVLVGDIVSTARTMIEAVTQLRDGGMAAKVCVGVHALFAGSAYAELRAAGAGRVVGCDTVCHASNKITLAAPLAPAAGRMVRDWNGAPARAPVGAAGPSLPSARRTPSAVQLVSPDLLPHRPRPGPRRHAIGTMQRQLGTGGGQRIALEHRDAGG